MKLLLKYSFILFMLFFQFLSKAQEQSTLSLGFGINSYEGDTNENEFLSSDVGINLGFYTPILRRDKFNLGVNISGAYHFTEDDFSNLENRIPIVPMEGLRLRTSSNTINQNVFSLGVGPQLNYKLADKFWISPILQAGYFQFNQDELILTQDSFLNDELFTTEVFSQEDLSESGLFIKPALRLSYQIAQRWNIWGESSYFIAEANTIQNQLVPFGEPNEQGQYFFDQVIGGGVDARFDTTESETSLNNFGVSFGIAYSFGGKKGYDHYKANTQKTTSSINEKDWNKFKEQSGNSAQDTDDDAANDDNSSTQKSNNPLSKAKTKDYDNPLASSLQPPSNVSFKNPSVERKEKEQNKPQLIGVLPANNSSFEDVNEIKNFTWKVIGDKIPRPQFIVEVNKVSSNQQPQRSYIAKTSKTSISAREVFKVTELADGQYRWKVIETTTGSESDIKFFNVSNCEINLSITNEEIECLGYEGENRKYKICFDSNYSSPSGDLTFADANSDLSVFDQSSNPISYTLVSPNTSLQTQTGSSPNTVSYCFEVTVPASVTEIGFGLQGDDLDPSPITCQPGASLMFDDLPDCICDDCENIQLSFEEYTISMNGNTGNQFDINGNLNVNVPIYGIEVQIQSYSYSANPSACTDGVSSVEESGMILMPGTTINGSTSLQLANETVSGSPNSNNNATKNIKYISSSALTGAIPMNLSIGLPGPLPGLDPSCCQIDYRVCVKIKVIYDETNCKSCVFTHCFTFNNQ